MMQDRNIILRPLVLALIVANLMVGVGQLHSQEVHWTEWKLVRAEGNPVIHSEMPGLEGEQGNNINGPSVIKVPHWIQNPLGKYYMYFAHHHGKYIRLAVADDPSGPWRIHRPGVLRLEETAAVHHIASPDVIIDNEKKEIRMYFHGPHGQGRGQSSYVAISSDGLNFSASKTILGPPYFRVFPFEGFHYAIANHNGGGVLLRSQNGMSPFEEGQKIIGNMRHGTLIREGNRLFVFFSRFRDAPERILISEVKLTGPWKEWTASPPKEVLHPEENYEGVDLPIVASVSGRSNEPLHELRDPYLFIDNEAYYLYYSIAGEQGIAMARFTSPFIKH